MVKDLEKRKKEFIKKLTSDQETVRQKKLVDLIVDIEKEFKKEGLLTEDIRNILVSIRTRLGLPEFIGVRGSEKEERVLEVDIINILNRSGGLMSTRDLLKNLIKSGWAVSEYALEKTLANLAKKRIINVRRGIVSVGDVLKTPLGLKAINYLLEKKKVNIKELISVLGADNKVIEPLIGEMEREGIIVRKGNEIYLVY